ncbi:N4-gp56 family major capsid protein [Pseudolactococcus yaeyamensis]
MTTTMTTDMIIPEVMADMVSAKLPNKLRLTPLAGIDTTLQGRPGNKINVPKWSYIGEAEDVAEGAAIPLEKLSNTTFEMTIKKAGKGVEISDEALLSGYGDPLGEATNQLALSIADKIDSDLIAAALTTPQSVTITGVKLTLAKLQVAIDVFGDEDYQSMILVTSSANAVALRDEWIAAHPNADVTANIQVKGAFASILGVDIIRSNKSGVGHGFLVKITADAETEEIEPAFKIIMKRSVEIEKDRDIVHKSTVLTADEHYGAYLYDPQKVVKLVTP